MKSLLLLALITGPALAAVPGHGWPRIVLAGSLAFAFLVRHRNAARGLLIVALLAWAAALSACPGCGADSVRIAARDTFSLGELTERFGDGPVPAKFALAEIGGTAVCFDLEAAAREPVGAA